jgi:hypothetical protein
MNVIPGFRPHALCSSQPWIFGLLLLRPALSQPAS